MRYDCLIVDDEEALARSTAEYFELFDLSATYVTTYQAALDFMQRDEALIYLVDINLDESSGFDLCKRFRETTDAPIFFISAREAEVDQILAFSVGGDDYIKKPYSLAVLLAKVQKTLERLAKEDDASIVLQGVEVDQHAARVKRHGEEVQLTALEYRLLLYLVQHRGRIVPKHELFKNVWEDAFVSEGTLNVHIRHLREKLEDDPNNATLIKTVRGRGYLIEG